MDRDRERPFNVYPKDTQHTREVAQRETERLFDLQRERDRQPVTNPHLEMGHTLPDREIPFHGR